MSTSVKARSSGRDSLWPVKPETQTFYEAAVGRAVEHVFDHLDEALDLAGLAKQAALSPLHFHRIFRGLVGETPLELHRRLRLERAAGQLVRGDRPVTRVAFDAGYETHESFTRAFGERYAASPSAFRARAPQEPALDLASPAGLHFRVGERPVLKRLKGESVMQVALEELPPLRLAAVRHRGPYLQIGQAFDRLGQIAGPAGWFGRAGIKMIGVYHDDPDAVPADELRSEAALSVPDGEPLPPGLEELRLEGGRYACAVHVGPYETLPDAWAELMGKWLPKSGHRVGEGPSLEIYLNNPMNAGPDELRTQLCVRLDT